jgi:Fe2+ or Zn2+ uptake regulation protein
MTEAIEQLQQTLKLHSQSLTAARRTVFGALQNQEPQTMHQLVERCKPIDRASVYRTVALFERLGVVQRLHVGWKYTLELSGVFHSHHHHATCLGCGSSLALAEDPALERRLRHAAEQQGFTLVRHQVELQGYCESCKTLDV